MSSLKRKTPTSPHGGVSVSSSAPMVLDKKLLPRIHDYLDSLDPELSNITPSSIVDYLRRTYPEYARKPMKPFTKQVESLCEKMRREALEQEQQFAQQQDGSMNDQTVPAASEEVVIISSVSTGATTTTITPSPTHNNNAQTISLTSPTTPSSASSFQSPSSSDRDKKRRKVDGGASTSGDENQPIEVDDGTGGDESSVDERDGMDVELVEAEDTNLANSAMRNLYNRVSSLNSTSSSASQEDGNNPSLASQKARERKPKEKVVYTQNSKKPLSAKKKANASKAVTNVHFQTSSGGPDDVGGGSGGDWHPEVLYPTTSYADLGGIEGILQEIHELIEYPLTHPEIYRHLGIQPPRGVLLHGPPGCGKTALAHAIAGELGIPFMKISAPEVVSGMSGESEQKIRTLFADALEHAPSILFIDEIDAITPKRATAQREMERRIVAQLLTCMDSLSTSVSGDPNKIVIVIGATNRPDSLDAALRRAGRFDREISLGIPDEAARARILQVMCREMKLETGIDWKAIAKAAVGYVGADLMALTREAAVIAINRIFRTVLPTPSLRPLVENPDLKNELPELILSTLTGSPKIDPTNPPTAAPLLNPAVAELTASLKAAQQSQISSSSLPQPSSTTVAHLIPDTKSATLQAELHSRNRASQKLRAQVEPLTEEQLAPLFIAHADFEAALKKVQPSSKREGFATIPDVTWNDIGALDELREELSMTILQPILNPQQFEAIGLTVPAGVLLFGPPGCGKTLVAKAIANESGASFLSIKGPELLNQYVGQSERAVRKVFQRARASAPCVIFFDELDALVPKRGSGTSEGNNVSERVVNQLLTEMDGLEERRFVFVIAATNRPDIIDPAMLRPGRLDKLLYVKLPSASERAAILRKHLRRTPLSSEVDIALIAADSRAEGFSGADVAALVREATLQALREAQQKQRDEMMAKGAKVNQLNTWASMKAATSAAASSSSSPTIGGASGSTATSSTTPLPVLVSMSHFNFAFSKVFPSVSQASRAKYDRMHRALCRARSTLTNENPADAIVNSSDATVGIDDHAAMKEETNGIPPSITSSPMSQPILATGTKSPLLPPLPPKQPVPTFNSTTTSITSQSTLTIPTNSILSTIANATAPPNTSSAPTPASQSSTSASSPMETH